MGVDVKRHGTFKALGWGLVWVVALLLLTGCDASQVTSYRGGWERKKEEQARVATVEGCNPCPTPTIVLLQRGLEGAVTVSGGRGLQEAINLAKPGTVIWIEPGTYRGSIRIDTDRLTLRGTGKSPKDTVIEGTDWYAVRLQAEGCVIENLSITRGDHHGLFITGAKGNIIRGCWVYKNGIGIQLAGDSGSASYNLIQGCQVFDNQGEGIYIRGQGPDQRQEVPMVGNQIKGNIIHDNVAEGIQVTATFGKPYPEATVITDNTLYRNDLMNSWGGGMDLTGNNIVIENNIVYDNGGQVHGIWLNHAHGGRVRYNQINVEYLRIGDDCSHIEINGNKQVES